MQGVEQRELCLTRAQLPASTHRILLGTVALTALLSHHLQEMPCKNIACVRGWQDLCHLQLLYMLPFVQAGETMLY